MKKLIKHEFREAGRLMLPLLLLTLVSGVLTAILQESSRLPDIFLVLSVVLFVVSLMAVSVIALVIVVGRFYENTMKDRAYLTMTLPVSVHGFLWSELLVCLFWAILTFLFLLGTFFLIVFITDASSVLQFFTGLPEFRYLMSALSQQLEQMNITAFSLVVSGLEILLFMLLSFFSYCLRFYVSMAIGQAFARHKILMSILAFMLLSILLSFLSFGALNVYDRFFYWAQNMDNAFNAFMVFIGLADVSILATGGCLYGLTAYLLTRKLNLA